MMLLHTRAGLCLDCACRRWRPSWGGRSKSTRSEQGATSRVRSQPNGALLSNLRPCSCPGYTPCAPAVLAPCSSVAHPPTHPPAHLTLPGLRPQHLTGLQLVAALCGGQLLGGEVGSSCITLSPGPLVCSHHTADTKTAGSCTLLGQSALPCLLFAAAGQPATAGAVSSAAAATTTVTAAASLPGAASSAAAEAAAVAAAVDDAATLQAESQHGTASELDLRGGTDAAMAPPVGYMQHVLLPTLRRRLGVRASVQLVRRGFFPRGQGQVQLAAERLAPGACLPAIDLTDRGEIVSIAIRAFTAGRVVPSVGERMADAALKGGLD